MRRKSFLKALALTLVAPRAMLKAADKSETVAVYYARPTGVNKAYVSAIQLLDKGQHKQLIEKYNDAEFDQWLRSMDYCTPPEPIWPDFPPVKGEPVTITITKDCYNKGLDSYLK